MTTNKRIHIFLDNYGKTPDDYLFKSWVKEGLLEVYHTPIMPPMKHSPASLYLVFVNGLIDQFTTWTGCAERYKAFHQAIERRDDGQLSLVIVIDIAECPHRNSPEKGSRLIDFAFEDPQLFGYMMHEATHTAQHFIEESLDVGDVAFQALSEPMAYAMGYVSEALLNLKSTTPITTTTHE